VKHFLKSRGRDGHDENGDSWNWDMYVPVQLSSLNVVWLVTRVDNVLQGHSPRKSHTSNVQFHIEHGSRSQSF